MELNKIYCCDNMELMSQIPNNTIDLIYSDILYGTGKNFADYQDLKTNKVTIDEHYISRIKEMHRILKDTGTMYLQMDLRIVHWLRIICDDIFLIALKNSFLIAVAVIVLTTFGRYVDEFEKKKEE